MEQVWVGLFVLVAAGLLITAVLAVKGAFSGGNIPTAPSSNLRAVCSRALRFGSAA